MPLTVNVVLHRENIDRVGPLIALAEELGASRLELANVQFYGWAFRNRAALLPTREQVERASVVAAAAKERLRERTEVLYVLPDYFGDRPKPCMNGWGRRYLTVNPTGDVLPCPTAYEIPSLRFDNVRDRDLGWIWAESESFNRYRGTAWMPEPCKSCDLRGVDFGGCRCQAALLTGDAANTDPACGLSPHHHAVTDLADRRPPPARSRRSTSVLTRPREGAPEPGPTGAVHHCPLLGGCARRWEAAAPEPTHWTSPACLRQSGFLLDSLHNNRFLA